MERLLAALAALLLFASTAAAQQLFEPHDGLGFKIDVTTTSGFEEIPGAFRGSSILFYNTLDSIVWVRIGRLSEGALVARETLDTPVPPGRSYLLRRPRTHTHVAAKAESGSGRLLITPGDGM